MVKKIEHGQNIFELADGIGISLSFARVENCQIGQNCQSGQKFLLKMVGGKRLVGCGQISLASNSKANGLNEQACK